MDNKLDIAKVEEFEISSGYLVILDPSNHKLKPNNGYKTKALNGTWVGYIIQDPRTELNHKATQLHLEHKNFDSIIESEDILRPVDILLLVDSTCIVICDLETFGNQDIGEKWFSDRPGARLLHPDDFWYSMVLFKSIFNSAGAFPGGYSVSTPIDKIYNVHVLEDSRGNTVSVDINFKAPAITEELTKLALDKSIIEEGECEVDSRGFFYIVDSPKL